jgi:hypothetical protein
MSETDRLMVFDSIMFEQTADGTRDATLPAPDCFSDLNVDQIVALATTRKEEYNLTPFFYMPLHDADAVAYRHEVMQDLERADLAAAIDAFAESMRIVRTHLAQLEKRYYEQQKRRWLLDAANLYVAAVNRLVHDLNIAKPASRGLLAFHEYLAKYASAENFTALAEQTKQLESELSAIRYSIFIRGLRVEVLRYQGNPDYGAEVEATFARFEQGAVDEYSFRFGEAPEMSNTEGLILEGVVHLYPDTFSKIEAFCAADKDFRDPVVVSFDREIQFYVAWLAYIAPLKSNRCEVPRRGWSRVSAIADRHPVLADSLDDGRDVGVCRAHECLAFWPLPGRPKQRKALIVDTVHEDRQQQALIDFVGVEQGRPRRYPQLHGGVKSLAPRARIDLAVRLAPVNRFEPTGRRREDVADVVVTHCDGGDRRELRGATMVERMRVDGEQRTNPFAWVKRYGAYDDRGDIAVEHGEIGRRGRPTGPAKEPLAELIEGHCRLRHGG